MDAVIKLLNEGKPARLLLKTLAAEEVEIIKTLNLLTSHHVLYVCNVAEADAASGNGHTEDVAVMAKEQGADSVVSSAATAAEYAHCPENAGEEDLRALDIEDTD